VRELGAKVAIVTGAASGIGLAMSERFAQAGMSVVMADVESNSLLGAQKALRGRGLDVHACRVDVADEESVQALAEHVRLTFGTWHLVCNNAGVQFRGPNSWEEPFTLWDWILGVNLMGVVYGIRTFVPQLIQQNEGHIVNTISKAAFEVAPGIGPYAVSKHGVLALSLTLAKELAVIDSAVKVSVLCPGTTQTNISAAERNWPARFGAVPKRDDSAVEINERLSLRTAQGSTPGEVADLVLQAVRDDRFWIFPDPEYAESVRVRDIERSV
jgi:NAD(P)-dependent dehydrogenase (short-subunit alcohol dehydrogenase family)